MPDAIIALTGERNTGLDKKRRSVALSRIVCSKNMNEKLPSHQLANFLAAVYQALIEKDRLVLCSLFYYSQNIFRLALPGVEAILPHYLFALDIVLIESSKLRLHPSIPEVEMRRACLRGLSSVVCWPTTFGMSKIPRCFNRISDCSLIMSIYRNSINETSTASLKRPSLYHNSVATGSILSGVSSASIESSTINSSPSALSGSTSSTPITPVAQASRVSSHTTIGEKFILPPEFSKMTCKLDTMIRALESTKDTDGIISELQHAAANTHKVRERNVWESVSPESRAMKPKQSLNIQNTSADFCGFLSGLGEGIEIGVHDTWTGHWSTAYSSERNLSPPAASSRRGSNKISSGISVSSDDLKAESNSYDRLLLIILYKYKTQLEIFSKATKFQSLVVSKVMYFFIQVHVVLKLHQPLVLKYIYFLYSLMGKESTLAKRVFNISGNPPPSRRNVDLRVLLVWLERVEDMNYFPIDELLYACDDGSERLGVKSDRPAHSVIFLYQMEPGLVQIKTKGSPSRLISDQ
uniref:Rap-GAP domain-containing protein n=1 Tax=Heterorhabditis bacteriophora TaxID=37862 RepID=A0A1I7XE43_HETBA